MNYDFNDNPWLLEEVANNEKAHLSSPSEYAYAALDLINKKELNQGDQLPWKKTYQKFGMRPAEVTVWAGVNGHGKSLLLGQILAWFPPDRRVLLASLEMPPARTIERLMRQTLGSDDDPTEDWVIRACAELDNITLYTRSSISDPMQIYAVADLAGREGYHHVVIDCLVKCAVPPDEFGDQSKFVQELCTIAQKHNIHIHLVHHIRKGVKESAKPDKMDIKGAGEITDQVDNIVIVHRNKDKERKVSLGESVDELEPDTTLIVCKQRHGDWEGEVALYLGQGGQFHSGPGQSRMNWRGKRI